MIDKLAVMQIFTVLIAVALIVAQSTGHGDAVGLFALLTLFALGGTINCVRKELQKLRETQKKSKADNQD